MIQYANERKHVCKDAMCMHKYMINNIDKQYNLPNNNSNVACYLQLKDNEKISNSKITSRNEKRIDVIPRINLLFSIHLFIVNGNTHSFQAFQR